MVPGAIGMIGDPVRGGPRKAIRRTRSLTRPRAEGYRSRFRPHGDVPRGRERELQYREGPLIPSVQLDGFRIGRDSRVSGANLLDVVVHANRAQVECVGLAARIRPPLSIILRGWAGERPYARLSRLIVPPILRVIDPQLPISILHLRQGQRVVPHTKLVRGRYLYRKDVYTGIGSKHQI